MARETIDIADAPAGDRAAERDLKVGYDFEQCGQLLDTLNELNLADERPVAALIGLAPDAGSLWADLRVGELKTMLALAIGDIEAIREGCEWVRQFEQLDAGRRRTYQCIATLLEMEDPNIYDAALVSLYGDDMLDLASDCKRPANPSIN